MSCEFATHSALPPIRVSTHRVVADVLSDRGRKGLPVDDEARLRPCRQGF